MHLSSCPSTVHSTHYMIPKTFARWQGNIVCASCSRRCTFTKYGKNESNEIPNTLFICEPICSKIPVGKLEASLEFVGGCRYWRLRV